MEAANYFQTLAGTTYTVEIAKMISYMGAGAFFYDLVLSLPFDWSIISGKRQRRWPQLAYFAARIAMIVYLSLLFKILWSKKSFACQQYFWALEFFMGIIVWTSSILLACRAVCVYSGSARTAVSIVLGVIACGVLAAWMQGVQAVTAEWLPEQAQPWNEGGCTWLAVTKTYWVKYICTIIFDAVVLATTTIGILRMNGTSRIGEVLIRQGVLYFVFTLCANLAITILTLLDLSPTMSLMASVPQSAICVLCASRLYIQLANEASPRHASSHYTTSTGAQQTSSYGSSTTDGKHMSTLRYVQKPARGKSSRLSSLMGRFTSNDSGNVDQLRSQGTTPTCFSSSAALEEKMANASSTSPTTELPRTRQYSASTMPFTGDDVEKQNAARGNGGYFSQPGTLNGSSCASPAERSAAMQPTLSFRTDDEVVGGGGDDAAGGIRIQQERVVQYESAATSPQETPMSHPYAASAEQQAELRAQFPRLLSRGNAPTS